MDRTDAGHRLAGQLSDHDLTDAVVLAVPRGGVPVASELAEALNLPLEIIVPAKLPIPWNPEAGFGAVTSDGTVVLNEEIVKGLRLSQKDIDTVTAEVTKIVRHREQIFRRELPVLDLRGKRAIVVDDGVASGYTMLAAVMSARHAGVREVTIAVPVASESAIRLLRDSVDELICLVESHRLPFAVADYYVHWRDLSEEEVLQYLLKAQQARSKKPSPGSRHGADRN